MGVEALPGGWRERVRPETEQVVAEVLAMLPSPAPAVAPVPAPTGAPAPA